MIDLEFIECKACSSRTGQPILCNSCFHNRSVISKLTKTLKITALSFKKFAPDLAAELIRRHQASDTALEEFIERMRFE